MNCKDCKYATKEGIRMWHGEDDQMICQKLSVLTQYSEEPYNHLAHTWDTDDYMSVLLVRDNFGCVEFEESSNI